MFERPVRARGFFLVFILLMTLVLFTLVLTTVAVSRQNQFNTNYHFRQLTALEAAEAGVVEVKSKLRSDRSWAPTSPYSVNLAGGRSSFRIQFAPGPSLQPGLSVNNLTGETPVNGPRGVDSVPPRAAFLVIVGFAGEATERLELIVKASPFSQLEAPLVTSGRQFFADDLLVKGVVDFDDATPVDVGIHSNSRDGSTPRITWQSAVGEEFRVEGPVSTAADSNVFSFSGPGTVSVQSTEPGAGHRPFPELNIEEIINGSTGASFTPQVGLNTISATTKYTGNLTIQGDLVLDNADLLVEGDLTVNGSITGKGSVFVLGDTEFSGASEVNVSQGHVALYSRGHVRLNGFRGTEFLESFGPISEPLERVKFALHTIQTEIVDHPGDWRARMKVDFCRALLGQDSSSFVAPAYPDPPPGSDTGFYNVIQAEASAYGIPVLQSAHGDSLGGCITELEALVPADPEQVRTVNFLIGKLRRLQIMSDGKPSGMAPPSPVDIQNVDAYLSNGTVTPGLFDIILDDDVQFGRAGQHLVGDLRNYSLDALGTTYFKGVLYSNGAIHCRNEVEIVGGVYVEKNRFSPLTSLDTGTRNLQAGDVQFDGGTRITYVEGLLDQSPAYSGNNIVTTVYWSTPSSD